MVAPRMFMESRAMVSRPLGVILTVRSAVFICGETDAMVPWTIVPAIMCQQLVCICATQGDIPFLSSIVTVSFWHFIKNLGWRLAVCDLLNKHIGKRRRDSSSPDELHIGRTGSVKRCALVVRVVWTKCVDSQCCLLSRSRSFSTRQLAL